MRFSGAGSDYISHSGNNQFEFVSKITTQETDKIYLLDQRQQTEETITTEIDYIGAINLTETFGAGKEPTKEQMDAIMEYKGFFQQTEICVKDLMLWGFAQDSINATEVDYDNSTSGLETENVQGAIDELSEMLKMKMPVSEGDEPSFTNKISTSIDTDFNVYQTVGYITGYRLNSTGALTPAPNAVTSGFIPLVKGDIIRVRTKSPVSGEHYISFYNSSFTYLDRIRLDHYLSNPSSEVAVTGCEIIDSTYEFTIDTSLMSGLSTMAYIRVNGRGYTAVDLDKIFVVTINQPIVWKSNISEVVESIQTKISQIPDTTLPPYIRTEAEDTANKALSIDGNLTGGTNTQGIPPIQIAFITDIHYNGTTGATYVPHIKESLKIIQETLDLDAIVFGGDYNDETTETSAVADIKTCKRMLNESANNGVPEIWLKGNHEQDFGDTRSEDAQFTRSEIFNLLGRKYINKNGFISNEYDRCGGYGYFDLKNSRVRFIVLNTSDNDFMNEYGYTVASGTQQLQNAHTVSPTQLQWIADNALDFSGENEPEEWTIVVLSHVPLWWSQSTYTDENSVVWQCSVKIVERLLVAFRNAVDFSETFNGVEIQGAFNGMRTTDKIVALHGHVHTPTSSPVSSTGVLSIAIPQAVDGRYNTYSRPYDNDINGNTMGLSDVQKVAGTYAETTFNVITIDRANRKVYAWCNGAGYDRKFDY